LGNYKYYLPSHIAEGIFLEGSSGHISV